MGLLETIKGAFGKSTDLAGDVAGKAQDVGEAAVDVAGDVAGATKDAAGSVVEKGKSLRGGGGDAESGDST